MDYKCGVCGCSLPMVDEDANMKLFHCSTPSCQNLMEGSFEEHERYVENCQAVEEKEEDKIRIDYEFPQSGDKVDGCAADVFEVGDNGGELYAGTMIYSKDLDHWNDGEFPYDVYDKDPVKCAKEMIEYRKE